MADQKAENLLNLALTTPEETRAQTEDLNVGYDATEKTWEVIVTYSGDLMGVLERRFPSVKMKSLYGGFAILTVPEALVENVIDLVEIEYAEKPKRLYFAVNQAKAASCILPVQRGGNENRGLNLSGRGVLIGIVDSGIDYFHEDFRNEDGTTRILYLYDQILDRVFSKEEIDAALQMEDRVAARALVPSVDGSGHGTAVAGIAAGNGRESNGRFRGVAYESELIIVRLGVPDPESFPRTTQVMEGLNFVVEKAIELGRPVAVNLSFGNTYGSHDGNGLLERYIDRLTEQGRSVFVIGTGNEGDAAGHVHGTLSEDAVVELSVAPYETGFSVQLWKHYEDSFEIQVRNPARTVTKRISERLGPQEFEIGGTRILVYYGEPSPFNMAQEIYFEFLSNETYVEQGIWEFLLGPEVIVDGQYDLWLPSAGALNPATRFLRPSPETTLTIPSTALRPVSVGAYDDSTRTYAVFSGRGGTRNYQIQKPDLAAPGVNIVTVKNGGGYGPVTGTSFAAPFVTGAAALLMEWGIVQKHDPYLYGEKVKAYLRKGARQIPGVEQWPNNYMGYGTLCLRNSFPGSTSPV